MGKQKDIIFNVPPDQMAELFELSLISDSFVGCISSASFLEEKEMWRKSWVSSQMAFSQKLEEFCLKYAGKEHFSSGLSKRFAPIMDFWGNKLILREME